MSDGNVWRSVKGHDGKLFFDAANTSDELRIGLMIQMDGFSRKTSVYGPSHSSTVASAAIANLPEALRYRTNNIIVSYLAPGPTEPTAEEIQHYNMLVVNDLINLYDNGRRVRVFLLAIICDHPAMCKMGSFAEKNHKVAPCPKCKVPLSELFSEKSLKNEFEARTGDEHRKNCFHWQDLKTDEERQEFFNTVGAWWTEFACLPYFDLVRYCVIDPMHNICLDTVKTPRELDVIHRFLEMFESPSWAAQLPARVGEPAGGSLTADEYKSAVTAPLAIIMSVTLFTFHTAWRIAYMASAQIPIVWETCMEDSQDQYTRAEKRYTTAFAKYEKELVAWRNRPGKIAETPDMKSGDAKTGGPLSSNKVSKKTAKHKDDKPNPPKKPARSVKIFLGRSITDDMVVRALELLQEYLLEYRKLYGEDALKPNFHWVVHLPDQVHDYGPVYNFWAFLSERLNKILKSFKSNTWVGGQLEISMLREFERGTHLDAMINEVVSPASDAGEIVKDMLMCMRGDKEHLLTEPEESLQDDGNYAACKFNLAQSHQDRLG
ncbi:hypothetical protein SCP_0603210 [Sparassis crispa]|uniref:Uncharacterized protein n=1 Tax=Sparassis crispa TaxID=139825 RepID=A0A401GQ44_9APHY|nr:hypothetical protein SCP_0603210 [Sparassis crispa]GBE84343.1 hypothetical protein SCP_0603210 [Sparassis crispa]